MGADVKADVTIPDIWYDVYARLMPGAAFVFGTRYVVLPEWKTPTPTELVTILLAGLFVGLVSQPMASWLVKALERRRWPNDNAAERIAQLEAQLGPESRHAKILSKAMGEAQFFSQLLWLTLVLLLVGVIRSGVGWWAPGAGLLALAAYSFGGCLFFVWHRLGLVEAWEVGFGFRRRGGKEPTGNQETS